MEEIIGDEMNSLLTLARILVTLDTGQIVSKDAAADMIAPTLNDADRALMELARDVYLGKAPDSWTGYEEGVLDLTQLLAERACALRPKGVTPGDAVRNVPGQYSQDA